MAVIQPSTQIDQEQFNSRFTSNNSIQQNISQVPYTYDGSSFINQRDSFQHHQATSSVVCPQPMNNYSAQQPINDINPTAISRNAAINLTGNISTQSKWCKPNNYIDNNQEYASLNSSTYGNGNPSDNAQTTASGSRQTQTDGYYNQDPNRSFYLNVANISTAASSTATPADTSSYQNYHVQNKPANWSLATTNDPSVCNNHGYYEIQNQQENIHDKLVYYHQQPQPNQSHQYPPEHYTDTSKFPSYATTNNYEHYFAHNHHAQGQHNVNFDTSRSYYYGGSSCSTEQLDDNSLQHPHLWAQSSQHHPQSSEIDMRAQVSKGEHSNSASQDASRVQEINQSWMSESQQQYATEENQEDQNNKQQETRFKNSISTVSNSCSGKQSFNDNGSIQKTNQCGVCGRNYARPSTLKTHLRTHTNERPFKCNVCLKTFSQAANLTAHQRVHTGEFRYFLKSCCVSIVTLTNIYEQFSMNKYHLDFRRTPFLLSHMRPSI